MENQDPYFEKYREHVSNSDEFKNELLGNTSNALKRIQFKINRLPGFDLIHDLEGGYVSISANEKKLPEEIVAKMASVKTNGFIYNPMGAKSAYRIEKLNTIDTTAPFQAATVNQILRKSLEVIKTVEATLFPKE